MSHVFPPEDAVFKEVVIDPSKPLPNCVAECMVNVNGLRIYMVATRSGMVRADGGDRMIWTSTGELPTRVERGDWEAKLLAYAALVAGHAKEVRAWEARKDAQLRTLQNAPKAARLPQDQLQRQMQSWVSHNPRPPYPIKPSELVIASRLFTALVNADHATSGGVDRLLEAWKGQAARIIAALEKVSDAEDKHKGLE